MVAAVQGSPLSALSPTLPGGAHNHHPSASSDVRVCYRKQAILVCSTSSRMQRAISIQTTKQRLGEAALPSTAVEALDFVSMPRPPAWCLHAWTWHCACL
jgi:hypothetical protein